jgi:hypothetical protein
MTQRLDRMDWLSLVSNYILFVFAGISAAGKVCLCGVDIESDFKGCCLSRYLCLEVASVNVSSVVFTGCADSAEKQKSLR